MLPKAELHVHLEGTAPPALIARIAARNGRRLPVGLLAAPDRFAWRDFLGLLGTYDLAASVIRTARDYRDVTFAYLAAAAAQGAVYVELIASPQHAAAVGILVALAAAVCFWVLISRSTKGYEARAVGFNPDAARYGGISVGRTYVWVMATCGVFAGLAGAMDVLGWEFRVATSDIQVSQVGFFGIAVALLGRNTALGTCVAALLFGALLSGTSIRHLDPAVFPPELGTSLTYLIQGVVVLLVSADILVVYLWRLRRRVPGRGGHAAAEAVEAAP